MLKIIAVRLSGMYRLLYSVRVAGIPGFPSAPRGLILSWAGLQRICSLWLQMSFRNLQSFAALISDRCGSYNLKFRFTKVKHCEISGIHRSTLKGISGTDHRQHAFM